VFAMPAYGRSTGGGIRAAPAVGVASELPATAAARAGLQSADVLVRAGHQPINRFEDLRRTLEGKRPGDAVSMLCLHNGEDHKTSATLGARPLRP